MADSRHLQLIIDAENKAGGAISEVQSQLSKLQSGMEPAIGASNKVALALGAATVAAGAFGIMLGKQAVDAAAEAQVQMAQFNTSMDNLKGTTIVASGSLADVISNVKLTGDAVDAAKLKILDAANATLKLGFDNEDTANSMAKFYQRTGDVNQAIYLNQTAMDLARAKNLDLATATNAVNLTLSGNGKMLKAYGIDLKESATPLEALGQLHDLVKGQATAFADTYKGKMEITKQALSELKETIGDKLLPILGRLADAFTTLINDGIPKFIGQVKELSKWLGEHQYVIYLVAGAVIGALLPAMIGLAITMVTVVIPAFFAAALALAPWIIGGAIIGGIIAGIVWIVQNWQMVSAKVIEIWTAITGYLAGIWANISGAIQVAWTAVRDFFTVIWDGIKAVFQFAVAFVAGLVILAFKAMGIDIVAVFKTIKDFLLEFWEALKLAFTMAIDSIKAKWTKVWTDIRDFLTPIWNFIKKTIGDAFTWVASQFKTWTEPLTTAWNSLWNGMGNALGTVWDGIKNTIKSGINWVIDQINRFIDAANNVASKGAGALGMKAPQIPNIPQLAEGGIVTSPTLALIGEAGPEMVIPLRSAGAGAGMGNINIYITGNEFMGEEGIADKIGNQIMRALRQNIKI